MCVVSPIMVDCCPFGQEAMDFEFPFWPSFPMHFLFVPHPFQNISPLCLTNAAVNQWLIGSLVLRKEVGDKFEIIFCSGDRDPGSFKGYYEEQQSKGGHLAKMFTLFLLKKHYGEASR